MTDTAPDAAVQIAADAICYPLGADGNARAVVAALARAGWLTPPAEVAALRAVADAARAEQDKWPVDRPVDHATRRLSGALAALPPAGAARAETQREPRVWLPGDTVPAGVLVTDGYETWRASEHQTRVRSGLVEAPEHAALVAAEQARRAAVEEPPPDLSV